MHQIGAVLYALWGLLHVFAAYQVGKVAAAQPRGEVRGRLYQSAWNLAFLAVAVVVVALVLNGRGSALGYWLNLALASLSDLGFILFLLVPGYLPLRQGILGPVLWLLAVLFSTLGMTAA